MITFSAAFRSICPFLLGLVNYFALSGQYNSPCLVIILTEVNFEVREGALTHWASQEMMEKFGAKRQPRGENFYTECVVRMHSAWPACSMGSDE